MTVAQTVYVDTSAAGVLLIDRPESGALLDWLDRSVFRSAGLLPMRSLRTLDALHLEAALRLDAAALLTYDHRLGEAARAVGLDVIAPGT
ncbi:MAG: hypothetical protein ACTH1D_02390 [Mycobacteriaceae bacterium]|uniref:hypothetical protein n=1 Tax=Corynebacterium sp. TaxID=1720 RepID=UPI003F9E044F